MHEAPIFQAVFGESWEALPPVIHKHYANRPFSGDVVTVEGKMRVRMNWLGRLMMPFMRLSRTLIPKEGDDVAVTVHLYSVTDSDYYNFDRYFTFSDGTVYRFQSAMQPLNNGEVIDWTRAKLGWHTRFFWDGNRVQMDHRGYVLRLGKRVVHLPIEWVLGKTVAWEEAIDHNRFRMCMEMRNPLFGVIYGYEGELDIQGIIRK